MDLYEALYTTRAMRRVKPDPIPNDVVQLMLDAAIRTPSAGNTQSWRFLAVTDRPTLEQIGIWYREAWDLLNRTMYAGKRELAEERGDDQTMRVMSSADWLAANFGSVPLVVFPFHRNDPDGSSIYPAVWNLMLAARGRGVGTTLTTVLSHFRHDETCGLLDVPLNKGWRMAAAVTCGYPLGKWGIADRPPVDEVAFLERWGRQPGWDLPPQWAPGGGD